jgi:hypothetical protein
MSDYHVADMFQRLLYQVTLVSGRIITRPEDFGDDNNGVSAESYYRPIFSEDGRLLTVEAEAARRAAQ